jgi:hypothetical protein
MLPYPPDVGGLLSPTWPTPAVGQEPHYYKPLPNEIGGQFDRASGNSVIIPRIVGAENFKNEVARIIGWGEPGGLAGTIKRTLAVGDGQGLGMIARRIVGARFIGDTGVIPEPADASNYPQGRLRQPQAWWNYDGGDFPNINQTAFKQKRYVRLDVEYYHPPYRIFADFTSPGDAVDPGERSRFCWSEVQPAMEYNTSDAIVLLWQPARGVNAGEAAPIQAGVPIAYGGGVGLPRPTGELVIHWERVPVQVMVQLVAKYFNNCYAGRVNNATFTAPFYDSTINFVAETLMFMNVNPQLRFSPYGPIEYDLDLHFQIRTNPANPSLGWNYFQEPKSGKYQRVCRDDGPGPAFKVPNAPPVFTSFDFSQLFRTDKDNAPPPV